MVTSVFNVPIEQYFWKQREYCFLAPLMEVGERRSSCQRAGGTWEEVEPLIEAELLKRGINVTVYDLE